MSKIEDIQDGQKQKNRQKNDVFVQSENFFPRSFYDALFVQNRSFFLSTAKIRLNRRFSYAFKKLNAKFLYAMPDSKVLFFAKLFSDEKLFSNQMLKCLVLCDFTFRSKFSEVKSVKVLCFNSIFCSKQ